MEHPRYSDKTLASPFVTGAKGEAHFHFHDFNVKPICFAKYRGKQLSCVSHGGVVADVPTASRLDFARNFARMDL
jgi:hypothetical protein